MLNVIRVNSVVNKILNSTEDQIKMLSKNNVYVKIPLFKHKALDVQGISRLALSICVRETTKNKILKIYIHKKYLCHFI